MVYLTQLTGEGSSCPGVRPVELVQLVKEVDPTDATGCRELGLTDQLVEEIIFDITNRCDW